MMDLPIYCFIIVLCIFIDILLPYLNVSIIPVFLFINLSGLYLLITRIHIDVNIRYRNVTE